MFGVVIVQEIVPNDGVRADTSMAPVPVLRARDDRFLTPVLVVVANAVGDQKRSTVNSQVDDSFSIRYRVGPEEIRQQVLGRTSYILGVTGEVGGGTLSSLSTPRSTRRAILGPQCIVLTDLNVTVPLTPPAEPS